MTRPGPAPTFTVPVLFDELWELPARAPRVGDQVDWSLSWGTVLDYRLPTLLGIRARVTALPPPGPDIWREVDRPLAPPGTPSVPAVVTVGALTASWTAPVPVPDRVVLVGVLGTTRYWSPAPSTPGTITRLRAVSWEQGAVPGGWQRIVGTHRLTDVLQVPGLDRTPWPGESSRHAPRRTDAVLVDLEVEA